MPPRNVPGVVIAEHFGHVVAAAGAHPMIIGQVGTLIGAEVDEAVVRRLFGPRPARGADGRGGGEEDPSEGTHFVTLSTTRSRRE